MLLEESEYNDTIVKTDILKVGDIVYVKANSKIRCWQPGVNYITKISIGFSGNFWVYCFNPKLDNTKYFGKLKIPNHYNFLVYIKQFGRSLKSKRKTIQIFKIKKL